MRAKERHSTVRKRDAVLIEIHTETALGRSFCFEVSSVCAPRPPLSICGRFGSHISAVTCGERVTPPMVSLMPDDEIIALGITVIGGKRHPDDQTLIWRGVPIGGICLPAACRLRLAMAMDQQRQKCRLMLRGEK